MTDTPLKVLVVEDEEGLAHAMAGFLKLRGLDAFFTTDGVEAVKLFEEKRPEVCVMDIQLGYSKLDGLEVLEKIKQIDPTTQCVMVTRITDQESIEKARQLGAVHYLLKPLDAKDWLEVVMEVVNDIKEGKQSSG
jgi:CheY-like chemotaxis protein